MIYQKIQEIRVKLIKMKLKKTGIINLLISIIIS